MAFQKLKHGFFLTRKNFPQFVEQFNEMVDFCNNIRGDADNPNDFGTISLDRSVKGHPVIRADARKFGGGYPEKSMPGCFEIVAFVDGLLTMLNPYYSIGGMSAVMDAAAQVELEEGDNFVCLSLSAAVGGSASIVRYDAFIDVNLAQRDMSKYIIPLYIVNVVRGEPEEGEEEGDLSLGSVVDLRNMPLAAMGEMQ